MSRFSKPLLMAALWILANCLTPAHAQTRDGVGNRLILAQASATQKQKEAFESAKELGTVEAWDAFLSAYPQGFYADLARAYVKKLAGSQPAPRAPAPAAPQPPPLAQLTVVTPLPVTVHNGPGAGAWQTVTMPLVANSSRPAYTAVVDAGGVQMTVFCFRQPHGPVVVPGLRVTGADPGLLGRLQHGLAAAPSVTPELGSVSMAFSDGNAVAGAAATRAGTNESVIYVNRQLLTPQHFVLESLMASQTVTITAPPFAATFQLDGSRAAICRMLAQCGAPTPSCGGNAATPVAAPAVPRPCPRATYRDSRGRCVARNDGADERINCGRGRTWVGAQGRCVCVDSSRVWNGSRCVRRRPQREVDGQDGPVNCGPGRTWVGAQGRCVCVEPGRVWNGSRCVRQTTGNQGPCTGGRTRDPSTGRCDCNGDSVWNGRACVKENEPRPAQRPPNPPGESNQTIIRNCQLLNIACQSGVQAACRRMATYCDRG